MSISDFLFNGSPPPSVTTYGSTTSSIPPWFEEYQQGLLNKSDVVANEPYQNFTAPSQGAYDALAKARQAPFTQATQTGWQMGQDAATAYQPDQTAASNATTGALAMPTAAQAGAPAIGAAMTSPGALATANPYLSGGTQNWPDAVSSYMNPYMAGAQKQIVDLSNQNLQHNILPSITNGFVGSGMLGSTRNGQVVNQALQDNDNSLNGALATNYGNEYNAAGQQFSADQSRKLTAGSTAGNLASTDMQNLLSAGSLSGNLANTSATTAGTLGQDLGALGQKAQTEGLTGASIYEGIGNQQQGQQQNLLDTMYNNFQNQTQYPEQQLSFMNDMIRGLQAPTSTTTTQTAPASSYSASPFAQILGAGVGLQGLLGNGTKTARRGGHIRGYANGGRVDPFIKMFAQGGLNGPSVSDPRLTNPDAGANAGDSFQYSRLVPGGYQQNGRYQPEMMIPGGINLGAYTPRMHGPGVPHTYSGYLSRNDAAALPGRPSSMPMRAPLGALVG